jgi:cyanate permease
MFLPAGVATAVGMVVWILCMAAGLGYQPGLTWIPWILPVVLGTAAAVAVVWFLGRSRTRHDTARLTAVLRL